MPAIRDHSSPLPWQRFCRTYRWIVKRSTTPASSLSAMRWVSAYLGVAQSLPPPRQDYRSLAQCLGLPPTCVNPTNAAKALQSSLNFSDGLRISSSLGESMTYRSFRPLPCSTRMACVAVDRCGRRIGPPQKSADPQRSKTVRITLCLRLSTASRICLTSSGLITTGSVCGLRQVGTTLIDVPSALERDLVESGWRPPPHRQSWPQAAYPWSNRVGRHGSRLGPIGLVICESSGRIAIHIGDMPVACAARGCELACPRSCVGEVGSLTAPLQDEARDSAQRHAPAIEAVRRRCDAGAVLCQPLHPVYISVQSNQE